MSGPPTVEDIEGVLDELYTRMFDDPLVGFFFVGKDKEHIVQQQVTLVRRMLGDASIAYEGLPIPEAHRSLPILAGHFDRRHHLLREILRDRTFDDDAKTRWLAIDQGFRDAVLKLGAHRVDELNRPAARPADPRTDDR